MGRTRPPIRPSISRWVMLAGDIQVGTTERLGLNPTVGQDRQAEGIGLARMIENDQDAALIGRSVLRIVNAPAARGPGRGAWR